MLKGQMHVATVCIHFLCFEFLLRFRAPELLHARLRIREGGQVVKER